MENNIDEDSLKRLNLIIEKTKVYDDCVFPVGTRGEFGSLYISDLKALLSELERYKQYYEEQNEVNKKFVSKDKFDEVNAELETYKKIVNKLACYMWKYDCCQYEIGKNGQCKGFYLESDCKQCIIDWARKEVEKNGNK